MATNQQPQRPIDIKKIISEVIETGKPKTISGQDYHQAISQLREYLRACR